MTFNIERGIIKSIENPDNETEVIIPDGVTEIYENAFRFDETIKRVVIADSVRVINSYSFSECINLSEVVFGKGLEYIGFEAFSYCKALRDIAFHDGLEQIGLGAFRDSGVERIALPDSVWRVEFSAFDYTPWRKAQWGKEFIMPSPTILLQICSDKKRVEIPDGVMYIAANVINDNKTARQVKELIIPDSVVYIDDDAFSDCALRRVHLGNDVSYIGSEAFSHCVHLKDINFPESLMHIGEFALKDTLWEKQHKCGKMLMANSHLLLYGDLEAENIELPEGVVEIAPYAFARAKVQHVVLPSSLRSIDYAFYECENLRSIVFKEGIEDLSNLVFTGADHIERICIPSTVKRFRNHYGFHRLRLFVELGFRVKKYVAEVLEISDTDHNEEIYIAPHIPVTAMLGLSRAAARGFMKCTVEGSKYDDEVIDGYRKYIEENSAEFYSQVCKYPFVLHYLCSEKLIPAEDIEMLLDIVKGDIELTALLLEYSADLKRTDYDI